MVVCSIGPFAYPIDSSVVTYVQERAALTYFYGKRKLLADGLSAATLEVKTTRRPEDHSFTHMEPRWKHPLACIVAALTGCGKTPFVARLLRNASTMIDPSPERVTWYNGEWQSAYENLDVPNLPLEEGLLTSFDASKHNMVMLDDLMVESINTRTQCVISHSTMSLRVTCLRWFNIAKQFAMSQSCTRGRTMRGRLRSFRGGSAADA